jgi:SNARE protein
MERASALDRAEKKLRAAQGTKRSYKMETRLVADPRTKQMYENKLSTLSDELARCSNDLKALKSGAQRGELFVGAKRGGSGGEYGDMTGEEAGDAMINEMNTIQDKTKSSLHNTKKMVAASKEVGEATMEELLRQREQIRNIDNEAMRIEDNLKRADKLIKTFGKRMATDKFIQCFAIINILLLVGVAIYSILKKGGANGVPAQNSPTSPVRMLRGLLFENDEYQH